MILLPASIGRGGPVGSVPSNYLNPADKDAAISLSLSNQQATQTPDSTWNSVRSITSHTSGKRYLEILLLSPDSEGYSIAGLATSAATLANYCGQGTTSWGLRYTGSTPVTFHNAVASSDLGTGIGATQRMMIAADWVTSPGNVLIWFGMNGTWVGGGNPGSGTGQQYTAATASPLFFMLSMFGPYSYQAMNNPGQNAHSIPSGFSMWN